MRLEADAARVAIDRSAAAARLSGVLGRSDNRTIGEATTLPPAIVPGDPEALVREALDRSPEIAALRAALRRSEAAMRLARLEERPEFNWSAGYGYRDTLDPVITGSFGIRLPVHRSRRQAQGSAQADDELTAAQADLDQGMARIAATARELCAHAERSDRLAELLGRGLVPQATSALEAARASYTVGRASFIDLLGDLRTLLDARDEEAEAEAERLQALAALEPIVGREIVITTPGSTSGGGR
jgi:outer membrane protein TolC